METIDPVTEVIDPEKDIYHYNKNMSLVTDRMKKLKFSERQIKVCKTIERKVNGDKLHRSFMIFALVKPRFMNFPNLLPKKLIHMLHGEANKAQAMFKIDEDVIYSAIGVFSQLGTPATPQNLLSLRHPGYELGCGFMEICFPFFDKECHPLSVLGHTVHHVNQAQPIAHSSIGVAFVLDNQKLFATLHIFAPIELHNQVVEKVRFSASRLASMGLPFHKPIETVVGRHEYEYSDRAPEFPIFSRLAIDFSVTPIMYYEIKIDATDGEMAVERNTEDVYAVSWFQ